MFKVLDKLQVGMVYCVSVKGNTQFLKNGLKLIDEKGNTFEIITVAISHYQNMEDYKKYAEIILNGDIENMGDVLFLNH